VKRNSSNLLADNQCFCSEAGNLLIGAGSKRLIGVARCLSAGGLQLTGSRWRGFRWDLARCPLSAGRGPPCPLRSAPRPWPSKRRGGSKPTRGPNIGSVGIGLTVTCHPRRQLRVDLMRSQAASGTVGPGSGFLADTDRLCRTVSAWRVDHCPRNLVVIVSLG
jgi:hypothetical protein